MGLTPSTQPPHDSTHSGYFVWGPDNERIAVYLHGEVVDQIGMAVMRGFAALRRRGVEVGGLLLGTVEQSAKAVVRVEEFVEIPCSHLHGPSYTLCAADMAVLDGVLAEYSADVSSRLRVVGFCRSNTREQTSLSDADRDLLNARFSGPDDICLLVQPFPTRPCEAILLTRGDGGFRVEPGHEAFVFRRKEMKLPPAQRRDRGAKTAGDLHAYLEELTVANTGHSGGHAPKSDFNPISRRRIGRDSLPDINVREPVTGADPGGRRAGPAETEYGEDEFPRRPVHTTERRAGDQPAPARRYRWFWLWLSLVLLLSGAFIGTALTLTLNGTQYQTAGQDQYSLGLSVSQLGGKFQLKWNPELPAWRHARGGELLVEEGTARKTQQLSADDLARGGLIYRGAAADVRFRLTLFLGSGLSLSETVSTESSPQP